ncbi:MAG: ADP-ribosylglycohydrolase family protein [Rhodobacteraceae bacterium]|nr:ADP-ribosylglycohydrolase family protein [Paracoccaceae bacterium]
MQNPASCPDQDRLRHALSQKDYLHRVYAGVLGKLIGVYLGRPFEGWTHERILNELGPIKYYVNEQFGVPLVVTDDDVAGTFIFVRALEDSQPGHWPKSREIGKHWLNYIVEKRAILWWGGNGVSTEHTAWLNLKHGMDAPESGSMATNGKTVAEQIGAQIFIDGWAMVAPGQPHLAAKLAGEAARVSHDGEAVNAAKLWAAMEAEAFVSDDMDQLIDTGLSTIAHDCQIARVVSDVRTWHASNSNWQDTRSLIDSEYGYHRYPGNCHVIPNHAVMIMSALYAGHDFQRGQTIVNTSGWDTDCNAGNVGCLMGIMLGLDGIGSNPDWRGPLADRMLISSADGGYSINDAVRVAHDIAALGARLQEEPPLPAPKNGAQFHFSLPGSTQGFRLTENSGAASSAAVTGASIDERHFLELRFEDLIPHHRLAATTPVCVPLELDSMRTYELLATPLIYPGQTLSALIEADSRNSGSIGVSLRVSHYGKGRTLQHSHSTECRFRPGESGRLEWVVPECRSQPIAEIGLAVATAESEPTSGSVAIDWMKWHGAPNVALRRPKDGNEFWHRAWVNAADKFSPKRRQSFSVSQDRGVGMIIHGTRQWTDYSLEAEIVMPFGKQAGLAFRVQGQRRYYVARICRSHRFEIARIHDDQEDVLAATSLRVDLDVPVKMKLRVEGTEFQAYAGDTRLLASDRSPRPLCNGGIGLLVSDGTVSTDLIHVSPVEST